MMEQNEGFNIFFEEKHTSPAQEHNEVHELFAESLPYLKRGDSSKYLDQFLAKTEQ
jgi:hypothetical protein